MAPPRPDAVLPPPVPGILPDGTEVRFLPVTPAHRERLRQGFEEASPESRYRRFLTPVSRLTDEQLDYLTNVDFVDHVAWGAETSPDLHGIGVGRWIRLRDDPAAADAAVAVLDAYQHLGVGTALLRLLAESAIERGIKLLRGEVLAENAPMLSLLESLGALEITRAGNVLQVAVPLPPTLADLQRTPAPAILRAAADGRLRASLRPGGRVRFEA